MKFTNFGTWFLKKHLLVQKRLQCWYDEYYKQEAGKPTVLTVG